MTGAEIEASVKAALRNKFAQGGGKKITIGSAEDINTDDILYTLKKIKPITKIGKEAITSMRKWSEDNAENVSYGLPSEELSKKKTKKLNLRSEDVEI